MKFPTLYVHTDSNIFTLQNVDNNLQNMHIYGFLVWVQTYREAPSLSLNSTYNDGFITFKAVQSF